MHIEIKNGDSPNPILGLHQAGGNSDIIKATKALTAIRMGVMGTARQIDADPLDQGSTCSGNRRSSRAPRALDHLRRPGEADGALLGAIQRPLAKTLDPAGVMRQGQLSVGCGGRFEQRHLRQRLLDCQAQSSVFLHREPVRWRQWKNKLVAVKCLHDARRTNV